MSPPVDPSSASDPISKPEAPGAVDPQDVLEEARRVIRLEARSVADLEARLDSNFVKAVEMILSVSGRVIIAGIGKSGIIARKIAATFTSTGTPATFLHPVEALHGDLGIVGKGDVAILLSKSGESDELRGLVEYFARTGVQVIAMTGGRNSTLARHSALVLDCAVNEEACPHDLAPTASTTATMALGDALALALLRQRGFGREQFARIHPGGALGRRLLLRVSDVMVTDDLPIVGPDTSMREVIVLLASKRGTVAVTDNAGILLGVVTAGDLTRLMERNEAVFGVYASEVMTREPQSVEADVLGATAVGIMERFGIMALPVLDEAGTLIGMVHLHDLMRAGAV
ncbi:MAG: KpsF/GutQ family sugar-phosphate isomerase [Gemmatimonadota bacterium]|nr:KpsF/GutQ family sugar-phosphate isomerase [Gemmatimonadota bacterium]